MTVRRRASVLALVLGVVAVGGCAPAAPAPAAIELQRIDGVGAYFDPSHLEVPVGTEVRWSNRTGRTYSTESYPREPGGAETIPAGAEPWESGPIGPGETFSIVLDVPGRYIYWSPLAPTQLLGTIEVTE